ncbi:MAG: AAA family ATPase [Bacteroidales bacterium]|nr:AAA family ATPase [Bacteroidales bacterium]
MITVTLTKGLPASGKSTWARMQVLQNPNGVKRINKDELREMLDCGQFTGASEKFVLKVRNALILQCIEQGKHVIIDDTNLNPKHEIAIRELTKGIAEVLIQDFTHVTVEGCIKNDLSRCASVGESVIRKMYNQYLKPKPETQVYNSDLPDIILCDLDGTLCSMNGRNPYDASTCDKDLLNYPVAEIIRDRKVIFVSGREDKYNEPTKAFLSNHRIEYLDLFMRKSGDNRKDSIIKREIFEAEIKGKYNVVFVLDDRNQVVELWRSLGLTCLQVADGDF